MTTDKTKFSPAQFINRELSWLAFNERVLEEVLDASIPLLERLKFYVIFTSNLDEFFEVRMAGFKQQVESGIPTRSMDGLTAQETFRAVGQRVRQLLERQAVCWRKDLVPALARHGIRFLDFSQLEAADLQWVDRYYRAEVRPVLTPLALDPTHPFPILLNKSVNLIVQLDASSAGGQRRRLAVVQVPRVLPPLVRLPRPDRRQDCLFLGHLIGHYLGDLFTGMKLGGYWWFRVTRNSELYLDDEADANLLNAVEKELHKRRRGEAVRLEVQNDCPLEIRAQLLANLRLTHEDLYAVEGPMNPGGLMTIYEHNTQAELRDPPFVGPFPAAFRNAQDFFELIRKRDVLLHHPYENFEATVEFLEQAAQDPHVLAIKQTLYRTGSDPRIVDTLMRAVTNGKQVTVVVELKARFDEANNIQWARRLEEAGVHVVYGLVGYKIHGKICLIVRREDMTLRRYVHLSTGNYNPLTSRLYTDLALFTCHPDFGEDATNLFNLLTGIAQFQGMKKLLVAPFNLHAAMLALIQREAEHARQGLPARIIAKMNSLVDRQIIEALYLASQAGVKIDLLVRGVCCLRPQRKRLSENITVRSIVDRFLEHSRIFYFENACQPKLYVGSADWMPRNFFGRVEVVFPIQDGNIQERVLREILQTSLADNVKARLLQPSGKYKRATPKPGEKPVRSQWEFVRLALEANSRPLVPVRGKKKAVQVQLTPSPRKT